MALRNVVQAGFTSHSTSISTTGGITGRTDSGTGVETYDGDLTTYYGTYCWRYNDDAEITITLTDEHTWADARDISKVYAKGYMWADNNNYDRNEAMWFKVYLLIDGAWTLIETESESGYSLSHENTHTFDDSTGWEDVTGIRYVLWNRISVKSNEYQPNDKVWGKNRVYETQAYETVKKSYAGVV